jgi:hypothetical protein
MEEAAIPARIRQHIRANILPLHLPPRRPLPCPPYAPAKELESYAPRARSRLPRRNHWRNVSTPQGKCSASMGYAISTGMRSGRRCRGALAPEVGSDCPVCASAPGVTMSA